MNGARFRVLILAVSDLLCLGILFLATTLLYREFGGGSYKLSAYLELLPVLPLFFLCNALIRLYHGNFLYPGAILPPQKELQRLVFSVTMTYLILFSYLLLIREAEVYSRFVLLVSWFLTCLLIMPCRNLARILMKKGKIGQIRVLIAGAGKTGLELEAMLREDEHFGFAVEGFLDDSVTNDSLPPEMHGKIIGNLSHAIEIARERKIDYLICCLPLDIVQKYLRPFLTCFKHLTIVPAGQVLPGAWAYPTNFDHLSGIEIRNQLLLPGPRHLKSLFEFIVSFFAVIFLLPLLLLLALLVKLTSRGPAIYGAKRLGLNGREIRVWKFRTMRRDAEAYLKKMLSEDPALAEEWKRNFKLENDPRITKFGRFLRKTSLDELPQLFNVLTGEMAMIGPRPIVAGEVKYYGKDYEVFSRVKPGITGLWQISGRSDTTYEQRVRFDLSYIMNWSVWLDIYILMRTVLEVLRCRGAK